MSRLDTSPVWKRIYPIISSRSSNVTGNMVDAVLKLYKDKLIINLLEYKCYTKDSFKSWTGKFEPKEFKVDEEMSNFIHLLSKEMDLDSNVTWTVVCNFLMFEYYGKVDELKSIIKYDTNVRYFIDTIWYFYSADRMFLLKTLRYIFENIENKNHPFHDQFTNFVKSVDMNFLWKNLTKVFENLLVEINRDKTLMVSTDIVPQWINRNHCEQLEVILLLIQAINYVQLDGYELDNVVILFLKHGFTRHPLYFEYTQSSRPTELKKIKYAEIGCTLSVMNKFFQAPNKCKHLPKSSVKSLEMLQGETSIIQFAWAVLKTTLEDTEESLDYLNLVATDLIQDVFGFLLAVVTHPVFSNSRMGDIVIESVFKLLCEFIKICADSGYLYEQEAFCYLIAELIKRKGIIVLDHFGSIFQLSVDGFPFVFTPFLEICKALISIPEHYEKIIQLLRRIPSFLTEIKWTDHRSKFYLTQAQTLYRNSDIYTAPSGTLVERFSYKGSDYTKFMHPFSFFTLLEHLTKSFIQNVFEVGNEWCSYSNLLKLVKTGYKFVVHILKHYKGDFKVDFQLKKLIQILDVMPIQFSGNSNNDFEFLKLYFEINSTLIVKNLVDFSEVFPNPLRKKLFPQVLNYQKISKNLFFNQIQSESILFRALKEEESKTDHSLLILYLELVQNLIENNVYHQEVQLAAMWYILNVVFPLYSQWSFEDANQLTKVCKSCCSIFVQILKQTPDVSNKVSNEIFTICLNSFLHDEVTMTSYLSLFLKDKFYVQNLMEQESNWLHGPLLEKIECIRLQLVLLLLLFKHRSTKSDAIDDKIGIIARAASSYMVNPYSVALRILSYRFLEILSRNENIPLMALLGLDYDQVQRLFLDRLRDPTEDDDLKFHILNLISTCISYQHGMTAAFFNVKRSRKWYSDNKEQTIERDTVSDFMIDYLHNIKKSHEYLRSPLQIGILNVMANLWISQKHHLISDVVSLEAFWPLLAEPLMREYNQSPRVYAQILKIFTIQLASSENETKFLSTVEQFITNDKQLRLWQRYMLNILKTENIQEEHIEERVFLLKSWMEFLIILESKPNLKFSTNTKYDFIEMSLIGVSYKVVNRFCLKTWMELCLIHISNWGVPDAAKNADMSKQSIIMLGIVKLHFNNLPTFSRSTILVVIQNILHNLKDYFENNTTDLIDFLEQIGPLFDFEYDNLKEEIWKRLKNSEVSIKELTLPWMMCINVANSLLQFKNIQDITLWFGYRNYLSRIIETAFELLNSKQTIPLTKLALFSLTKYVESPLSFDFLNVDMIKFYNAIEPAISTLFFDQDKKGNPLQLEEGWETCIMIMKFNAVYINKFQYSALPTCYSFMRLFEQTLQYIFNIPESMIALRALDLLIATLEFFDIIMNNWQLEWYRKSNLIYNFILSGVKKVINSCLYTILRPKNILIYTFDNYYRLNQIDKIPMELLVGIMDKLIIAVGVGCSILYKSNSRLVDLWNVHIADTETILITNDFSVPKFELPIPYTLTYGMLLCLAHFLCKTLDAPGFQKTVSNHKNLKKYYSRCFALVDFSGNLQDFSSSLHTQKLSSFLRYAMYESSGLADPFIQKLDHLCASKTLDLLMLFLTQQIYLVIQDIDTEHLPYFKRNLSSELQFFYDYVKKCASALLNQVPVVTSPSCKLEMDTLKRYLLQQKENNCTENIAEQNFSIVMSHWLMNVCQLR